MAPDGRAFHANQATGAMHGNARYVGHLLEPAEESEWLKTLRATKAMFEPMSEADAVARARIRVELAGSYHLRRGCVYSYTVEGLLRHEIL